VTFLVGDRRMRRLFLTALFLTASIPAQAQTDAAPAKAVAGDPNKVICKRETVIGSLVAARKVCRTRAEWLSARTDAQRDTQMMQGGAAGQAPQ
jgi:hypothetical protein